MKKLFIISILGISSLLAQGPTNIQQSGSKLDTSLNAQNTATTATTLTLTPPAGQSVYITEVDFVNCQDATGVAAAATPTFITTTNLGGLTYMIGSGSVTNAGACAQSVNVIYPTGLKSATPGTAVTVVTPSYITHQNVRVNVQYFFAP